MKRSYDDMITHLSVLPDIKTGNDRSFKSDLTGVYNLRVTKVTDISKPADKPIEEIDEPEEEDRLRENQLSKNNARMIQLDLKDARNNDIKAIEVERIEMLTHVKPNCTITIIGPVEVRCSNIMLQPRHLTKIEGPFEDDVKTMPPAPAPPLSPHRGDADNVLPEEENPVVQLEDWPEDEVDDDLQVLPTADTTTQGSSHSDVIQIVNQRPSDETKVPIQVVQIEDWDEDDEEDCIVLD